MTTGLGSSTRRRGRRVDTTAPRHTGLSLVLLVAPFAVLAVALTWFVPEGLSREDVGLLAVGFVVATSGAEWVVLRLVRRHRRRRSRASHEV